MVLLKSRFAEEILHSKNESNSLEREYYCLHGVSANEP